MANRGDGSFDDFIVNRTVKGADTTVLERNLGGWKWSPVTEVKMRVKGNELHLVIPRAALAWRPAVVRCGLISNGLTMSPNPARRRISWTTVMSPQIIASITGSRNSLGFLVCSAFGSGA